MNISRRTLSIAAISAAALSTSAIARSPLPYGYAPNKQERLLDVYTNALSAVRSRLMSVEVIQTNRSNDNYPIFKSDGGFVLGAISGEEYSILLTNHSPRRLMAVVSVDGLNVITGETAKTDQVGYILEPFASTKIEGWRKSLRSVAKFKFGAEGAAYAARTGRPDNIGVMGVAIFEERVAIRPPTAEMRATSKAAPAARLGTEHGDRATSVVKEGSFNKASSRPADIVDLEYASLSYLESRNIAQRYERPRPRRSNRPSSFPGNSGFAPDPQW